MGWMHLIQVSDQWRNILQTVVTSRFHRMWIISQLADVLAAHFAGISYVVLVNAVFFRGVTTCIVTCPYLKNKN